MLGVMTQMAALIACGAVWRRWRPGGVGAAEARRVLTTLVYYLLLPALVLQVMWTAPLGLMSLQIAAVAALTVLAGLALTAVACRVCAPSRATMGAMLLVAAWPNAIYLGLPILDTLFGASGRAVAIQFDLFGALPLLLTVGVLIARRFGTHETLATGVLRGVFLVPSIWAAMLGALMNLLGAPIPVWVDEGLGLLAHGVTPLMLFSLGLALVFDRFRARDGPALVAVSVIQLLAAPVVALVLVAAVGLDGVPGIATVLEAAMPAMVLGLVFCDRFGLDTGFYAAAVTLTTALSLVTLPLWFALLQTLPFL